MHAMQNGRIANLVARAAQPPPTTMGDQETGADHAAGGGGGCVSPCNYIAQWVHMCTSMRCEIWMVGAGAKR